MTRLDNLVKVDNRFEKSVNLLLDLNDEQKLKNYIPTHSSVNILSMYLKEVQIYSGGRANILVGPYGKGKSHLLLVLLAILSGRKKGELDNLISRIGNVDKETADLVKDMTKSEKILPVIINTGSGNLAHAYIRSLNQALKREHLEDVVPDNYFSEALKAIKKWEKLFPETYKAFEKKVGSDNVKKFILKLERYDYQTLDTFRKIYPELTSGSQFNPLIEEDVLNIYKSVNRVLCRKYGYSGIYIVFDEFSKYIEGHREKGFAADMKVLQDICELCNSSKEEPFFLTCVAHKPIRSYGNSLLKEVKNAFRGVEGRMKEIFFTVSSQNNFELIADAIEKKKEFYSWIRQNEEYKNFLEESYCIPDFRSLFDKQDFDKIVGEGCFPLTPLTTLLLLNISEKIAQNERTIFTFLASQDMYSLAALIKKMPDSAMISTAHIYDYFLPLFMEEGESMIHNEWLKTDYALSKTENEKEEIVIKSLSIIRMVNKADDIPANVNFIRLASGLKMIDVQKTLEDLCSRNIVSYRRSTGAYEFQNNIGIDIENEVVECAIKYFLKIDVAAVLNEVCDNRYILPKKYNQDYLMTRYYRVIFMKPETFLALSSVSYLDDENSPDGYISIILLSEDTNTDELKQHIKEIGEKNLILAIPEKIYDCTESARLLLAVRKLLNDRKFIENNEVLVTELISYERNLVKELNQMLREIQQQLTAVYTSEKVIQIQTNGLNRVVSDICEQTYYKTPVINHELINRHNISAQISKARNIILDDFLHANRFEKYEKGTSAEATIYRAVFMNTAKNENLREVTDIILMFIHESKGKKNSFDSLVNCLTSSPIGMRKGVIPFYLVKKLMELEDMPVVYLGNKELPLDAGLFTNIMAKPADYSLYIEEETIEKLEYIEGLEQVFKDFDGYCKGVEGRNRLSHLTCIIQTWYRSLPQTSRVFKLPDFEGQEIRKIDAFRKLFSTETNPREVLFERIPKILGSKELTSTLQAVKIIKSEIDQHIFAIKTKAVLTLRNVFELNEFDDLKITLAEWYAQLDGSVKNRLLSVDSQRLFNCIRNNIKESEDTIIERVAKEVTGFYVEDWSDTTVEVFKSGLEEFINEIRSYSQKEDDKNNQKIVFASNKGIQECLYNFDEESITTSGYFFKNMLDDLLDEYGDSLENNEKIGILMNTIKRLMEE